MAVLAKMVVSSKIQRWGKQYPPEHYSDDHWFTNMAEGKAQTQCPCEMYDGISSTAVELMPVYSKEVGHENHEFWQATPSGKVELTIENAAAADYFEVGQEYYVEMRKARK